LRLHRAGGRCLITVGATVLFDYDAADTLMQNMAISALRRLGFPGRRVAAVTGLTERVPPQPDDLLPSPARQALTGPRPSMA
jgi:hypothetical protein